MFTYSSTTVWQKRRDKTGIFTKPKRQVHIFRLAESIIMKTGSMMKSGFDKTIGLVTSRPAKIVLAPAFWAWGEYKKIQDAAIGKLKQGAEFTRGKIGDVLKNVGESTKIIGGFRNSIARTVGEFSLRPVVEPAYHMTIKNTGNMLTGAGRLLGKLAGGVRDGVFGLIKSPGKIAAGTRKAIGALFSPYESINNGWSKIEGVGEWLYDKVANPTETIKNTRDSILGTLGGGIKKGWDFSTIPGDLFNNIKNSLLSPFKGIANAWSHGAGTVGRTVGVAKKFMSIFGIK